MAKLNQIQRTELRRILTAIETVEQHFESQEASHPNTPRLRADVAAREHLAKATSALAAFITHF